MNILMILAHPDDEVIFGWPVIQTHKNDNISLLTLSHNRTKYGGGPENALKEVCAINKIQSLELPRLDTNFYRLPPRYEDYTLPMCIKQFKTNITQAVGMVMPDIVFTHNPMGEYGHGDHKMVFNLVAEFCFSRLLLTDICFFNKCHLSSAHIPSIYEDYLYDTATDKQYCELDLDWYNTMMRIYRNYDAWSWGGHDPVTECNLYKFV